MTDYGFIHDGHVFTPNGTTVATADNATRNARLEAAELRAWNEQPETFVAYYHIPKPDAHLLPIREYRADFRPDISRACVTTWRGTTIGRVVKAHVYRHNFGGRMVALQVEGTNGARYHGRASWDNGTCVRLRRAL